MPPPEQAASMAVCLAGRAAAGPFFAVEAAAVRDELVRGALGRGVVSQACGGAGVGSGGPGQPPRPGVRIWWSKGWIRAELQRAALGRVLGGGGGSSLGRWFGAGSASTAPAVGGAALRRAWWRLRQPGAPGVGLFLFLVLGGGGGMRNSGPAGRARYVLEPRWYMGVYLLRACLPEVLAWNSRLLTVDRVSASTTDTLGKWLLELPGVRRVAQPPSLRSPEIKDHEK